jgi:hypothetical protein
MSAAGIQEVFQNRAPGCRPAAVRGSRGRIRRESSTRTARRSSACASLQRGILPLPHQWLIQVGYLRDPPLAGELGGFDTEQTPGGHPRMRGEQSIAAGRPTTVSVHEPFTVSPAATPHAPRD